GLARRRHGQQSRPSRPVPQRRLHPVPGSAQRGAQQGDAGPHLRRRPVGVRAPPPFVIRTGIFRCGGRPQRGTTSADKSWTLATSGAGMWLSARCVSWRRALVGTVVAFSSLCPLIAGQAPQPGGGKQPEKNWLPTVGSILMRIEKEYPSLEALYKQLHASPELAFTEEQTAARMAKELKALGFEVTTKVGGTGVVGVFKNGPGPTVLVRTDMDALPVTEATGLPYASKVRTRDKDGREVGVMHACGHDMHMTCWVGTARVLVALKDHWKGPLVFRGQPAEEIGTGARLMLEAGLYKKFPKPDYGLALHCDAARPHGTVGYTEGLALANVDSVDITVKGKGGHGAAPHTTV